MTGLRKIDVKDNMVYVNGSINKFGDRTNGKNENAIRHFALSELGKKILMINSFYSNNQKPNQSIYSQMAMEIILKTVTILHVGKNTVNTITFPM